MQRIVLILLLLILLLSGRHPVIRVSPRPETMTLVATPIALDASDPARRQLGDLRYLGGWALQAGRESFGGISSLRIAADGSIVALGDGGEVMTFPAPRPHALAHLRLLPILPTEKIFPRHPWDTESMTWESDNGRIWVGFEYRNRICRYSPAFGRVERCATPDAIRDWPSKSGMESLTRLPDGRFIAIAEAGSTGPEGAGHDVLLFGGDPVDPATPPPMRLSYDAPQGYLPTDALAIGHGRMLVLNRRFTIADGFTGVLVLLDIRDVRPGRWLAGKTVARLELPIPHDNFEALAMGVENGPAGPTHVLWIASDDNHLFFQRSLLMKFAMPDGWFAD